MLEPREGWISDVIDVNYAPDESAILPCVWKSLISVAYLVFPFSLLWPTSLTCSGRASVTVAARISITNDDPKLER